MKKIVSFILVTLAMLSLASNKAFGLNQPYLINILDLTNLKFNYETGKYDTKTPIDVDLNMEYTFNVDKEFLGNNNTEIIVEMDGLRETLNMSDYGLFYGITFITTGIELNIVDFEFEGIKNSHMMLFKGDDSGFEDIYSPFNEIQRDFYGDLTINYDDPHSAEEVKSLVTSINSRTKELTTTYLLTRPYVHKLGKQDVIYSNTVNNIISRFKLTINVIDDTPPVIVTNSLSYEFGKRPTIELLKEDIVVTDNAHIIEVNDIAVDIDNYSTATSLGDFDIEITVTDKSLNTTTKTISVNLYSKSLPTIIGPEALFVYISNKALTNEDILASMKYTDDFDKDKHLTRTLILDEYNGTKEPGKYNVIIEVTNLAGLKTTKSVVIHVIADETGTFVLDLNITTTKLIMVSEEEIFDLFSKQVDTNTVDLSSVKINKDVYNLNYDKKGIYKVYIEYEDNNVTKYAEVSIEVNGSDFDKRLILLGIPAILAIAIPIVIIIRKKR